MKQRTRFVIAIALTIAMTLLGGQLAFAHSKRPVPRMKLDNGASVNWSGYAVETNLTSPQTGAVTDVTGSWVIPFVTGTNTSYSSAWLGIDGYSDSTVEQIGTDQDINSKTPTYYAWYEMYPAGSINIPSSVVPVNPGNTMSAEVKYVGSNQYVLTITNVTWNKSFTTTQTATAQRTSAEWIMEAPGFAGRVLPLANFGTINISGAKATLNGVNAPISHWAYDEIVMETFGGTIKAQPSPLNQTGDGFSVTWKHK